MTPSITVQAFAYAALKAASDNQEDAITALEAILAGQYTASASGNGKVLTTATATNKSFTYTLPSGFGPKEVTDITFQAIQLLKSHTSDELEILMFRRRRNVALASIGGCR